MEFGALFDYKKFCRKYDVEQVCDLLELIFEHLTKCYASEYGSLCQSVALFLLKSHREPLLKCDRIGTLFTPLLTDFMMKATSKVTVKFLLDIAHRFPNLLVPYEQFLIDNIATSVRGQQRAIAAELLLKINYAPDHFNSSAIGKIISNVTHKKDGAKPNECVKIEKQAEIIVATLRLVLTFYKSVPGQ